MNIEKLKTLLEEQDIDLKYFDEIDSTNLEAKRLVNAEQLNRPLAIVANAQTAGYGRNGRSFYSPKQVGMYLTLVLPAGTDEFNPGKITTALAVLAVEVIRDITKVQAQIKWVNDLYLNEHKVGGILTELDNEHLIIGMGLNLEPANYPTEIAERVGALSAQNGVQVEELISQLTTRWLQQMQHPVDLMERYQKYSNLLQKKVVLAVGQQEVAGIVTGFGTSGEIILESDQGQQAFHSGEVIKVLKVEGLEL